MGLGSIIGSVVGEFTEDTGAVSDFTAEGREIRETSFTDPNAVANKAKLDKLAADAAARQAPTAAAQTVAPAPTVGTTTVGAVGPAGPTTLGQAAQVNASTEFRAGQQDLTQGLQQTIAGGTPTVAGLQLRSGSEDIIRNQRALAAGAAPGADAGAVARNLARGVGSEQGRFNQQQAELRAGEIQGAQQILAQTLQGARGADVETAVVQATFQQQRLVEQGKIDAGTAIANLENERQLAISQGNIELATRLEQAQGELQVTLRQSQADQAIAAANLEAELQNQKQVDDYTAFLVSSGLAIDAASAKARQDFELAASGNVLAIEQINAGISQTNAQTAGAVAGGLIGGIAAGGSSLLPSDIHAKMNIEPGDAAVREVLDKLKPYEFEYRPGVPGATEGRVIGVMAQDLMKSELGRKIVHTESSPLSLDMVKAVSLALASGADNHQRLKKLELAAI